MTQKEIAERLRELANGVHPSFAGMILEKLTDLADMLDPPRPEPGTVVWWRIDRTVDYHIGLIGVDSESIVDIDARTFPIDEAQYKPARITGPDDHGEEALSDMLGDRMHEALDYINMVRNHYSADRDSYRAHLANLTAILEGNQEADE